MVHVEVEFEHGSLAEGREARAWLDRPIKDDPEFTPEFEPAIQPSEREVAEG